MLILLHASHALDRGRLLIGVLIVLWRDRGLLVVIGIYRRCFLHWGRHLALGGIRIDVVVGLLLLRVEIIRLAHGLGVVRHGSGAVLLTSVAEVGIMATDARHKRFGRGVVEVLGLLANTIVAGILKAALDAALTGPFVA